MSHADPVVSARVGERDDRQTFEAGLKLGSTLSAGSPMCRRWRDAHDSSLFGLWWGW